VGGAAVEDDAAAIVIRNKGFGLSLVRSGCPIGRKGQPLQVVGLLTAKESAE
jgi:hypothetical protein